MTHIVLSIELASTIMKYNWASSSRNDGGVRAQVQSAPLEIIDGDGGFARTSIFSRKNTRQFALHAFQLMLFVLAYRGGVPFQWRKSLAIYMLSSTCGLSAIGTSCLIQARAAFVASFVQRSFFCSLKGMVYALEGIYLIMKGILRAQDRSLLNSDYSQNTLLESRIVYPLADGYVKMHRRIFL